MGYSQTQASAKTSDLWTRACIAQTGSSNVYVTNGQRYFWERGHEQPDGAETGVIFKMDVPCGPSDGPTYAQRVSGYRIEPDGTVRRAPAFLRTASATRDTYLRTTPGARERALTLGA